MEHTSPAVTATHGQHRGHGNGASATATGHDRHEGHSVAMFRDRFWLSLVLTIPVVAWSPDLEHWLGYTAPTFPGSDWVPAVLGTAVFFYGGLVFIRGAVGELRDRQPGMMTLISLAIVVAFVTSWAGTLGLFEVEIAMTRGIARPRACGHAITSTVAVRMSASSGPAIDIQATRVITPATSAT